MERRTVSLAVPLLLILLSACSAGAAPPSASPVTSPPAIALTDPPDTPISGGGGADPGQPAEPRVVVPRPGQRDPHDVSVNRLQARIDDGGRVIVRATFYSGVEPCYVLDSVVLTRRGNNLTLTLREGTGQGDVACIDIAVLKATDVDLGVLPAGTYTIQAGKGDAAAIQVTVP
jgi:hypothetical protein